MPYIKQVDRGTLIDRPPKTAGELNYIFTLLCVDYLKNKGESYQTYNEILGALEGCKLEIYARKVRPYEEKKCQENGDVY